MGLTNVPADWSLGRRLLFRFVFVYFVVYVFPFPLAYLEFLPVQSIKKPLAWYESLWNALVPWVGEHLFGVTVTVRPNGSGDTTYNYVQLFCYAVLAVAAAAVWSLLDRKRRHYTRLARGLRIYVRFYLAATMIVYGAAKVIQSQFPAPSLDRLMEPFGAASPMGLLWTFMGASRGYNLFTGLGEMVPGLLLTARRTTLLGALLSIGVLGNVVTLNVCYDVPVKLFSSHLLAMAVYVALPDLGRLANVFVLNRPAPAADLPTLFARKWLNRGLLVLRTVVVAAYAGGWLYFSYQQSAPFREAATRSPFYGVWDVDELTFDGKSRPPLVTDTDRWRRVTFDYPGRIAIQLMDDSRQRYALKLDEDKHRWELTRGDGTPWKSVLTYTQTAPGLLAVEGRFDGHRVRARLRHAGEKRFLLTSRGFHWINEYPFNR